MKSIVRRDTEEGYIEYLKCLAEAGLEATDQAALRRMDRRRKKKGSNEEWVNPYDPEAEITRLKNGRTALAYKAEHAVDMDSGAIVAVTTHGGAVGDSTSVGETLPTAGEAVAEQITESTPEGRFKVNPKGVEELVADKGYHAGHVLLSVLESEVRSYIAEPDRGRRKWAGKRAEQVAVYANRQRIGRHRGKQLLRRRGELVERTFAHAYETGAAFPEPNPVDHSAITWNVPEVLARMSLLSLTAGVALLPPMYRRFASLICVISSRNFTMRSLMGFCMTVGYCSLRCQYQHATEQCRHDWVS